MAFAPWGNIGLTIEKHNEIRPQDMSSGVVIGPNNTGNNRQNKDANITCHHNNAHFTTYMDIVRVTYSGNLEQSSFYNDLG